MAICAFLRHAAPPPVDVGRPGLASPTICYIGVGPCEPAAPTPPSLCNPRCHPTIPVPPMTTSPLTACRALPPNRITAV
uniref:Uncharacterized protein n=1 Tax=Triticum urartu TaxID=4572 RepID=A0A8R7TTQ6_TRIUA